MARNRACVAAQIWDSSGNTNDNHRIRDFVIHNARMNFLFILPQFAIPGLVCSGATILETMTLLKPHSHVTHDIASKDCCTYIVLIVTIQ